MNGVSEVISYVIIILISIVSITIAIYFVNPIIEKSLNSIAIEEAINNMRNLENIIKIVLSEAVGSQRVIEIGISRGYLYLRNNSLNYFLESYYIPLNDFSKKENNLLIEKKENIFSINLNFENIKLSGEFYLSSGKHKICILKEKDLELKLFIC